MGQDETTILPSKISVSQEHRHHALDKFAQRCKEILQKDPEMRLSESELHAIATRTWNKFLVKHEKISNKFGAHGNNNTVTLEEEQPVANGTRTSKKKGFAFPNYNKFSPNKNLLSADHTSRILSLQTCLRIVYFFLNLIEAGIIILVLLCGTYILVVLHKPIQSLISRNSQDMIYPFMRGLRLMTLPILRKFPSISELYEESCLISNPEYLSTMVDCWPCETVKHVINLTSISNFSTIIQNGGLPFVITDPNLVPSDGLKFLKEINYAHSETNQNFINLYTNHGNMKTLDDTVRFLETNSESNVGDINQEILQIAWKINRISTSRILRKYFPKPKFVSGENEISLQHFLLLDGQKSTSHSLPLTEFSNVYIAQVSGLRHVVLVPTQTCQQKCKTISTVLQPSDIMYYNWMYWRPVSAPLLETDGSRVQVQETPSISFVSSFY